MSKYDKAIEHLQVAAERYKDQADHARYEGKHIKDAIFRVAYAVTVNNITALEIIKTESDEG